MNGKKKVLLYLSLTGMSEPLGRSQVLEYLFEIGKSYDVSILSCEKTYFYKLEPGLDEEIKNHGIQWKHIYYSNRYGLLSASLQFVRFVLAAVVFTLLKKPDIVHARSLIPAGVALVVKIIFRKKVLFDIRGFFVDEKVDSARLKKGSLLYHALKSIERTIYRGSDRIITLTFCGKDIVCQEYGVAPDLITVIPTCVNTKLFTPAVADERAALRRQLSLPDKKIIVHHGQVKGWYDFESEVILFKAMYKQDKNAFFLLLNKDQQMYIETILHRFEIPQKAYSIRSVDFSGISLYLNACDLSIFFIKPTYSKKASHPTKFAENTACRLYSLSNRGIGDMDFYAKTYKTAFLIDLTKLSFTLDETAAQVLEIINNPAQRAINDAYDRLLRECFSNEIAVERYLSVYNILLN